MTWPVHELGQVCDLRPSKAEARKRLKPGDPVSFVPMSDLPDSAMYLEARETRTLSDVEGSYTYFADGDVLLAKITPCFENGKLAIARSLVNGVGFGSSEYFVIRPPARILPEFLYYFLSRQELRDAGSRVMTGASGHQRVPKEFIEDVLVPIPPLAEQKRIVALLDAAFDGFGKASTHAARNLANARDLAASVVDKLLGQGSGGRLVALENAVTDDCTLSYGIVQPGGDVSDGLPIVRPTDLGARTIDLDGLKRIAPGLAAGYQRTTLKGNDLLLCVRGTTGTVSQAAPDLAGANVTRGIVPIRFDPAVLHQDLGYFLLRSDDVQQQIRKATYGTALMQINIRDLRRVVLRVPLREQQDALVRHLEEVTAETDRLERRYRARRSALLDLRTALLHHAFSGQLAQAPAIAA